MKKLIDIRNRIEHYYKQHNRIGGYILRLILCLAVFFALRGNLGYNTFLSNVWVIIGISVLCAFLKVKYSMLVMLAYIVVQMSTLSMGIGMMMMCVLILMYLLYLRYVEQYGIVLIIVPLLFICRLPLLVPLVLGIIAPASAVIALAFGNIIYYAIHYININSAVISGLPADMSEINKASMVLRGIFSYKEFLYTAGIMILVFIVVFFLKKINVNQSFMIAILSGAGVYMIAMILANLIFGTISSSKLLLIIVCGVASAIIALFIAGIVMPLDYSRTEMLEFEDEEYYYFVRAVPKANIARESVNVKRISSRRRVGADAERKDDL